MLFPQVAIYNLFKTSIVELYLVMHLTLLCPIDLSNSLFFLQAEKRKGCPGTEVRKRTTSTDKQYITNVVVTCSNEEIDGDAVLESGTCSTITDVSQSSVGAVEIVVEELQQSYTHMNSTPTNVGVTEELQQSHEHMNSTASNIGVTQVLQRSHTHMNSTESNIGVTGKLQESHAHMNSMASNVGVTEELQQTHAHMNSTESNIGVTQELQRSHTHMNSTASNIGVTEKLQESHTNMDVAPFEDKNKKENTVEDEDEFSGNIEERKLV
jgi:hypothetical protein